MVVFPNARITLGLQVTDKRADGYHNIRTLMVPVSLYDALEVVPAPNGDFRFRTSGLPIPGNKIDNLCVLAVKAIQDYLNDNKTGGLRDNYRPVHVLLHKGIAAGAGLAGGSADGAFMLKALDAIFKLALNDAQLKTIAAKLGSDCPFFIENKTKLVTGRGEQLEDFHLPILKDLKIMIVVPPLHIDTAAAYSEIQPKKPSMSLQEVLHGDPKSWQEQLCNDFEAVVSPKHTQIAAIKDLLKRHGAFYTSLSGSGSAVFGLFLENPPADRIRQTARGCQVFSTYAHLNPHVI